MIAAWLALPVGAVLIFVAIIATRSEPPDPPAVSVSPAITLVVTRNPKRQPHETLEMYGSRTEQALRRLNRELSDEVDYGRRDQAHAAPRG